MPESDEPDEEILKIAKAGVLGMASAIGEMPVPPDEMPICVEAESVLRALAATEEGAGCETVRRPEAVAASARCEPASKGGRHRKSFGVPNLGQCCPQ
jgi:hypothetical protein